jgi:molybdenum cofactor biosynthesis enzyme MoaA
VSILDLPQIPPQSTYRAAVNNVVFDMVDRCNLVCPSCYHGIHGGTKKKMSLQTCKIVLDHCVKYFSPKSIWPFNWGEPFICEELPEFIRLFARYPMSLSFSSNMNQELPEPLIELILTHAHEITFSVSALEQGIYKKYHRGGKIDRVMSNIRKFVEVRDRIESNTVFIWSFGLNKFNSSQVAEVRRFCEQNRINLGVIRYYVTDAVDVHKILHGKTVNEKIYKQFYDSVDDVRTEISENLTPSKCALLKSDIVVDTDGYLMLCCATKITTKVHVTEVTTVQQLVKTRLGDEFCKTCFNEGLVGYFGAQRA